MGIASGVLWVLFGILYIWYKALREDPANTIAGTIFCVSIVAAVVGFFLLLDWLLKANLTLGIIFGVGGCVFLVWYCIKGAVDANKEKQKMINAYENVMRVVRQEEYTEDEIFKYAMKWRMFSPDGWKYYHYGYEKCKPLIIEDYRKNVRYYEVARKLREENGDNNNAGARAEGRD